MIPFADYCATDAVNWSSLLHLWKGSPLHYRHHRESADKDTTGRKMGRLLHALALGSFDEEFVIFEEGDRRGKAWEAFKAANPGRTILKPNEIADVRAQAAAVRAHREASRILAGADTEATIQWTDPDTGLPCKGRLDRILHRLGVADVAARSEVTDDGDRRAPSASPAQSKALPPRRCRSRRARGHRRGRAR